MHQKSNRPTGSVMTLGVPYTPGVIPRRALYADR